MTPQRALFDPQLPVDKPSWLVVRKMTGAVLDSEEIPPGADLKRVFVATMIEWLDAGWEVGEFSSTTGTFFCTRGSERRMVGIEPAEPGHRLTAAAHLGFRAARAAGIEQALTPFGNLPRLQARAHHLTAAMDTTSWSCQP